MSTILLRRMRAIERITRQTAAMVAPEWREPFRIADYHRPYELVRRNRGI